MMNINILKIFLIIFMIVTTTYFSGVVVGTESEYGSLHIGSYANYTIKSNPMYLYLPDPKKPGYYYFEGFGAGLINNTNKNKSFFYWKIIDENNKYYIVEYFARVYVDVECIKHPGMYGVYTPFLREYYDYKTVVNVSKLNNIVPNIGKSNLWIVPERDYKPSLVKDKHASIQNNSKYPIFLKNFFGHTIRWRIFYKDDFGISYKIETPAGNFSRYFIASIWPSGDVGWLKNMLWKEAKSGKIGLNLSNSNMSYRPVYPPSGKIIYDEKTGIMIAGHVLDDVIIHKLGIFDEFLVALHDTNIIHISNGDESGNLDIYVGLATIIILLTGTVVIWWWKRR